MGIASTWPSAQKLTYGEVPVKLARPRQQLLEALHKAAPMHGSVNYLGPRTHQAQVDGGNIDKHSVALRDSYFFLQVTRRWQSCLLVHRLDGRGMLKGTGHALGRGRDASVQGQDIIAYRRAPLQMDLLLLQ